ncbi:MAG TPA: hypothetical protein VMZ27_00775, partial [Candidatus Saccharimonadales bacterium]|nr:hypothetical protein [Candidatus Saccharimonadales bacterium]
MLSFCRLHARCALGWCRQIALLLVLASPAILRAQTATLHLSLLPRDSHGWIQLRGRAFESNAVITIDASSNLVDWRQIAVLHASDFDFLDPASSTLNQRFYRFRVAPITATNDWKNQVANVYEPFARGNGSERWVKFAIATADPTRVLYADANRYTFHYNLVSARMEPFVGISPAEFDQISQFNAQHELVLGTVLYPGTQVREYGIQFVSHDPLPRELVRDLFELVKSTVVPDSFESPVFQAFYVPTFEQLALAQTERDYFASNGIPVTTADRWAGGDLCYSKGWALGTLKFFSATNVPYAYANGQLLPRDILIT